MAKMEPISISYLRKTDEPLTLTLREANFVTYTKPKNPTEILDRCTNRLIEVRRDNVETSVLNIRNRVAQFIKPTNRSDIHFGQHIRHKWHTNLSINNDQKIMIELIW